MSDANSVMVPREPTEAMISAMHNAEAAPDGHSAVYGPIISCNAIYTAQYRAALAAAPASLGVEGEEVVAFWDGVKVTSDADARKAFKYVQTNFHSIPMVALRQRSPPTGLSAEEVEALERCGLPWNIDYSTDVPIPCAAVRRAAQPDAPKPGVDDAMVERALEVFFPDAVPLAPIHRERMFGTMRAALQAALGSKE